MRAQIVSVLAPGLILIILGGALIDVWPGPAGAISLVGFVVLVGWPLLVIVTEVRHRSAARRTAPDPAITLMIVLPVALLGGLGVFCLVTAAREADHPVLRAIVGVACLLLLATFLVLAFRGRSALTLRFVGVPVALLGIGIGGWAITDWSADGPTLGTAVGLIASVALLVCGGWLAMTGRNSVRRPPDRHPARSDGPT